MPLETRLWMRLFSEHLRYCLLKIVQIYQVDQHFQLLRFIFCEASSSKGICMIMKNANNNGDVRKDPSLITARAVVVATYETSPYALDNENILWLNYRITRSLFALHWIRIIPVVSDSFIRKFRLGKTIVVRWCGVFCNPPHPFLTWEIVL